MKEYKAEIFCAGCDAPIFRKEDADQAFLKLGVTIHYRIACLQAYERVVAERIRARGEEPPPEDTP